METWPRCGGDGHCFNSEENRRILQGAGDAYIIGEKLRPGKDGRPHEALKRAGKYKKLANGLEIKEVVVRPESAARRRFAGTGYAKA